jgi:hypothetical protein
MRLQKFVIITGLTKLIFIERLMSCSSIAPILPIGETVPALFIKIIPVSMLFLSNLALLNFCVTSAVSFKSILINSGLPDSASLI